MNKEFIPYEQALELKELGFDEDCFAIYRPSSVLKFSHLNISNSEIKKKSKMSEADAIYEGCVALPLYQQAFRWFREKYGWIGGIRNLDKKNQMIVADFVKDEDNLFMIWAENYEDAELKALKELIKIVKNK